MLGASGGWVDAAGAAVVALGALAGGLTGFGYGLVATPFLVLLGFPVAVAVAVNMVLGMCSRVLTAVELRASVDRVRVGWLALSSLPGLAVGVLVVHLCDEQALRRCIGLTIIASAIAMVCLRGRVKTVANPVVVVVGFVSGVLGVTSSLNGIPPALLYAYEQCPPRRFLADLSAYFVVSNPMIFVLVVLAGGSPLAEVVGRAVMWLPGVLAATFLANRIAGRIPLRWFRLLVLGIVLAGGVAALLSG